ncbi:MAG: UDP-N-acetylglucosamine 2-epimerase [Chthonomonadales bacterium]
MRSIGVVTVGRSDYGIYHPLLKALQADPEIDLHLYISGMHLSSDHGFTADAVEADGYQIADRIDLGVTSDTPEDIATAMGESVAGFAQSFARWKPDILVVLGDRYDMFGAVLAALPFLIPVAHIHGGELTFGAMDDSLRHSLTKLSHIHFTSAAEYARRVIQMGEEPWRVHVTGAPSLDNVREYQMLSREELEAKFDLDLSEPFLLATYHPVTLEFEQTPNQIIQFLDALDQVGMPVIFTMPNADTSGSIIRAAIQAYTMTHTDASIVENFGSLAYFSMMKIAAAMVGNSSSGLVEGGIFQLPVVNVGNRQEGRLRGPNVIDCGYETEEIVFAIKRATTKYFKSALDETAGVYGDGNAVGRIMEVLKSVELGPALVAKRFYDVKKGLPEVVCPWE